MADHRPLDPRAHAHDSEPDGQDPLARMLRAEHVADQGFTDAVMSRLPPPRRRAPRGAVLLGASRDDVLPAGLVQPPNHAWAVWKVHVADPVESRRRHFLERAYPRLVAWHEYLLTRRDRGGTSDPPAGIGPRLGHRWAGHIATKS